MAKKQQQRRIRLPDGGPRERELPRNGQARIGDATRWARESEAVVSEADPGTDDLGRLLVDYDNENRLSGYWGDKRKETGRELIEAMKASDLTRVTAQTEVERLTGTLVSATRSKVIEARLRKALGAKLWGRVTTPMLDEKKLEAAIELGEVDPHVVASCMEESVSEYLRVTRRTRPKAEDHGTQ